MNKYGSRTRNREIPILPSLNPLHSMPSMQVSVLVGTGTFSGLIAKPDSAAADRMPLPLKASESDDAMSGSSSKRSPSDWAHRSHLCVGTGLAPTTSAPGFSSHPPHVHRDWAPPATSRLPMTAKSAGRKDLDDQDVVTVADASEAWRARLKVSAFARIVSRPMLCRLVPG